MNAQWFVVFILSILPFSVQGQEVREPSAEASRLLGELGARVIGQGQQASVLPDGTIVAG